MPFPPSSSLLLLLSSNRNRSRSLSLLSAPTVDASAQILRGPLRLIALGLNLEVFQHTCGAMVSVETSTPEGCAFAKLVTDAGGKEEVLPDLQWESTRSR